MANLRFIHTADLHLDSPYKGLTNIPKHIFEQVQQSTFNAFDQIIDYCVEKEVDFLLIAGDVYDIEDQSLLAQMHFLKGLERLASHEIAAYIIHGNHDPVDKTKNQFTWPPSVHFFSDQQVESIPFLKDGKEAARIYGRSYPTKLFNENIVKEYRVAHQEVFHIGLLHTNVDGNGDHASYAPCTTQELKQSNIDYWALGHIHKGQVLIEKEPVVAYPGNPQGRHIKETGLKGCLYVEVNQKSIQTFEWLPTSTIIWEELKIDVSEAEAMDEVIHIVQEIIDEKLEKIAIPLIVRIQLIGKTKLHFELHQNGVVQDLQEIISNAYRHNNAWVWIESIQSKTKPFVEITELLGQETFLADFMKQHQEIGIEEVKAIITETINQELLENRSMRKNIPLLDDEDVEEIREKVLNMALDYFLEEGLS